MTKKFNADKHRFGMGYYFRSTGPVYPFYISDNKRLVECLYQNGTCNLDRNFLTRAPEHDLVPMADIKPLLDTLEKTVEQLMNCEKQLDVFHGLGLDAGAGSSVIVCDANRALEAFTQKHGE